MIVDSGTRREFETGAVRDITDDKGRCDLVPLDVISKFYKCDHGKSFKPSWIFHDIHCFQQSGNIYCLLNALRHFQGFDSAETMLLETAMHFEEGAKKYGEYNWQKGIPVRSYIDSSVRHLLKWMRGDTDERHDRAFVWNILCAVWTCLHKPELNDYRVEDDERENDSDN